MSRRSSSQLTICHCSVKMSEKQEVRRELAKVKVENEFGNVIMTETYEIKSKRKNVMNGFLLNGNCEIKSDLTNGNDGCIDNGKNYLRLTNGTMNGEITNGMDETRIRNKKIQDQENFDSENNNNETTEKMQIGKDNIMEKDTEGNVEMVNGHCEYYGEENVVSKTGDAEKIAKENGIEEKSEVTEISKENGNEAEVEEKMVNGIATVDKTGDKTENVENIGNETATGEKMVNGKETAEKMVNGKETAGNETMMLVCNLCHSDEKVVIRCLDCDEVLCRICSMIHEKIKATRDHQTIPIEQDNDLAPQRVYCSNHTTEEINLFCKTCDMFICTDCVIDNHRKHDFTKSSMMVKKAKEELQIDINHINSEIPIFKKKLQSVQKLKADNTTSSKHVTDHIRLKQQTMVEKINKVCEKALKQYNEIFINNDKKLNETEMRLETDLLELELMSKNGEVLSMGTDDEIFKIHKIMQNKLKEIKGHEQEVEVRFPHYNEAEMEQNILVAVTGIPAPVKTPREPIRRSQSAPNGWQEPPKVETEIVSTFKHRSDKVWSVCPVSEDRAWIHCFHSCNIVDLVNKKGQVHKSVKLDFYVTDFTRMVDGNLIVCSYGKKFIKKLAPDGNVVSDVCKRTHLHPRGLCVTLNGDILVCMIDDTKYDLVASSKRRVVRMNKNGRVIHTMEFSKKGDRLFTAPIKVAENPVTRDICVVDDTGCYSGRLCILDNKGHMKATYCGEYPGSKFHPCKVVCDSHGQIIVCDQSNHKVHLLDSTGQFMGYLLREKDGYQYPTSVSLDTSGSLWVACWNGQVHVMKY